MKNDKSVLRWGLFLILALLVSQTHVSAQRQSLDDRILEKLDIEEGMTVADIGAGNGAFTVKIAQIVGPDGHVYANEINTDRIRRIRNRIEDQGIENITVILGEEEDAGLPAKVDFMVLKYVYHHLDSPDEFMTNLAKYLNPGGRLAVIAVDINHVSEARAHNEDRDACVSDPKETAEAIEKCGFRFEKKEEVKTPRNVEYILIFKAAEVVH